MEHLVYGTDWRSGLQPATDAGTTVSFVWGRHDEIGDRHYASTLPGPSIHLIDRADHHLPITHPDECRAHLAL